MTRWLRTVTLADEAERLPSRSEAIVGLLTLLAILFACSVQGFR